MALDAIARAATRAPDGKTVALVFASYDFLELILNWACHALAIGVHWFALVAMDLRLHRALSALPHVASHAVLLPRVRRNATRITKLNVIGERQRFGLQVLERGVSVVHSDADALWIKDPWPLLAAGDDVVAERIWGKPLSVVKAWGAGICTGFYYLRATPAVVALARTVRDEVSAKRKRQPSWQASDQYFINTVLHRHGVTWAGGRRMEPQTSMATRYLELNTTRGVAATAKGQLRIAMLAHGVVPRACPVLSAAELSTLRGGRRLRGKARWWQSLLRSAHVLHCFPPGGDPAPGEKRFVFMGHPKHTQAELAFAQRQGLWRLDGTRRACRARRR